MLKRTFWGILSLNIKGVTLVTFPLHNFHKNTILGLSFGEISLRIDMNLWHQFGLNTCGADFTCLSGQTLLTTILWQYIFDTFFENETHEKKHLSTPDETKFVYVFGFAEWKFEFDLTRSNRISFQTSKKWWKLKHSLKCPERKAIIYFYGR